MTRLEAEAIEFGKNPANVRKKLAEAKAVVCDWVRQRFKKNRYDLPRKRLLSDDGTLALQWQLRPDTGDPDSPTNQQTSKGCVVLVPVR